jgi:hypothetical protein
MDKTQIISLLLGSAAVGALMSSVITLLGQVMERRSRIKELIFSKAVEMAQHRAESILAAAKHTNQNTSPRSASSLYV